MRKERSDRCDFSPSSWRRGDGTRRGIDGRREDERRCGENRRMCRAAVKYAPSPPVSVGRFPAHGEVSEFEAKEEHDFRYIARHPTLSRYPSVFNNLETNSKRMEHRTTSKNNGLPSLGRLKFDSSRSRCRAHSLTFMIKGPTRSDLHFPLTH